MTAPSSITPSMTNRHKAIRSLRASATTMTLRTRRPVEPTRSRNQTTCARLLALPKPGQFDHHRSEPTVARFPNAPLTIDAPAHSVKTALATPKPGSAATALQSGDPRERRRCPAPVPNVGQWSGLPSRRMEVSREALQQESSPSARNHHVRPDRRLHPTNATASI